MSNIFKLCPTHFSRGGEKILGGLRPLRPPWLRACVKPNIGLWLSSEPCQKVCNRRALRLRRGAWRSKNWQKLHCFTVLHISI